MPSPCKVCGRQTAVIVNILLAATPVCDPCCLAITKQTVASLSLASLQSPRLSEDDAASPPFFYLSPDSRWNHDRLRELEAWCLWAKGQMEERKS